MRNAGGYHIVTEHDGRVKENDTFTCGHCNKIVLVKPKQDAADMGGMCKLCMKLVCDICVDKMKCDPFEKKLERMESRNRLWRTAIES